MGLLAIATFPIVHRYQPAIRVEPEYAARVITRPGPLAGVVKSMQAGAEMSECEYELLGWSVRQGALYGREVCTQQSRVWALI